MYKSNSLILALFITLFIIYTSIFMHYRNDIKIIKPPQIWSEIAENIRYQKHETEEYDSIPDTGNGLLDETAKDNEKSSFIGRMSDGINSSMSSEGKDTFVLSLFNRNVLMMKIFLLLIMITYLHQ